ncbi:hypothetical protein [Salegentibacter holothuriorum]|uniref:hypothetical protein n=1 Tax=Salegentibacter holothuriorum TaxID=241145 RepID=UPI0011168F83|nr:hypothetical protein [Salegentibacter holothuriorum]
MQNLAKEYPEYSKIFEAILDWFERHPNQRAITMDYFYSDKYSFSIPDINITFMILKEHSILKTVYRVIDEDGSKISHDFLNLKDIPTQVDTMWGNKKDIEDVDVIPFYALEKQNDF